VQNPADMDSIKNSVFAAEKDEVELDDSVTAFDQSLHSFSLAIVRSNSDVAKSQINTSRVYLPALIAAAVQVTGVKRKPIRNLKNIGNEMKPETTLHR